MSVILTDWFLQPEGEWRPSTSVEVVSSDASSSVETATVVVATTAPAEIGTGADSQGAVARASSTPDAATGTDSQGSLAAQPGGSDTSSSSDQHSLAVSSTTSDAATGVDAQTASASASSSDVGAATDSQSLAVGKTESDVGSGADAQSLVARPSSADQAVGSDWGTGGATQAAPDSGSGSETASVGVQATAAETASGADAQVLAVAASSVDAGSSSDQGSAGASLAAQDTGSSAEAAAAGVELADDDAGSTAYGQALSVALEDGDEGTGAEQEVLDRTLYDDDEARGADNVSLVEQRPLDGYPSYAEGYAGAPYGIQVRGGAGALLFLAPDGEVSSTAGLIAGPTAGVVVSAPAGADPSSSTEIEGPLALAGSIAWPGVVETGSGVPIGSAVEGELATVNLRAPVGGVRATASSGRSMPRGVAATLVLRAPAGLISTSATQGGVVVIGSASGTAAVEGTTARLVITAPPGVLVTSDPNLSAPPATITVLAPEGEVEAYQVDTSLDALTLQVIDTSIPVQPGLLRVALTNGEPESVVNLFIGDTSTPYASVTLDETGSGVAALSVSGVVTGSYEISAATTSALAERTPLNTGTFEVAGSYVPLAIRGTVVPPPMPVPPLNHWVFQPYDLSGPVREFSLPVNPARYAPAYGGFRITSEAVVEGGTSVSWEGTPQVMPLRFAGNVLTKAQYLLLEQLADTTQRFWVTDHLLQRRLVKITDVSFQRVRDRARPWHHAYEVEAAILQEVTA